MFVVNTQSSQISSCLYAPNEKKDSKSVPRPNTSSHIYLHSSHSVLQEFQHLPPIQLYLKNLLWESFTICLFFGFPFMILPGFISVSELHVRTANTFTDQGLYNVISEDHRLSLVSRLNQKKKKSGDCWWMTYNSQPQLSNYQNNLVVWNYSVSRKLKAKLQIFL